MSVMRIELRPLTHKLAYLTTTLTHTPDHVVFINTPIKLIIIYLVYAHRYLDKYKLDRNI